MIIWLIVCAFAWFALLVYKLAEWLCQPPRPRKEAPRPAGPSQEDIARRQREQERKEQLEKKRNAIPALTAWYGQQKRNVEQALPEGNDRQSALDILFDTYDRLLKEKLREIEP